MTKEERRIYLKKYQLENRDKISKQQKLYYQENKENIKKYQLENKEKIKLYRQENKEKTKKYFQENKDKINSQRRKNRQENINKFRAVQNKYYNLTPARKLKRNLRGRLSSFFKYKGHKKKNSTEEILGANWKTVEAFMEAKFVDGMNWDNIGEWHIDHIIPLSYAETEKETIKLCHYTNLQPLWAFDNLSKGNKLDWVKE